MDRGVWRATIHGVARVGHNLVTKPPPPPHERCCCKWDFASTVTLVVKKKKSVPIRETAETQVRSLGWEDSLEKEIATHSRILAWRIPWTGKPGELQPMGSQRVGRD